MAYSTTNPPQLVTQAIAGVKQWFYSAVDADTLVQVSGYFTNGYDLGMRAGDLLIAIDNDAVPPLATSHIVVSDAAEVIDIDDGVPISGADTD